MRYDLRNFSSPFRLERKASARALLAVRADMYRPELYAKSRCNEASGGIRYGYCCARYIPRGENVPDDEEGSYDFGLGAGFYVDATQAPWDKHYKMYSYIVNELPALIESEFPVTKERAISGHSMGGHGALVIGMRNPNKFVSVSAFSPISNPSDCPWGEKALGRYLGDDKAAWQDYDASLLLASKTHSVPLLVEQGTKDEFLHEQLKPQSLVHAAQQSDTQLTLNMHEGYDHSYFFIASFIEEHLEFHAGHMGLI